METRQKTSVYLIGSSEDDIRLKSHEISPSNLQVLKYYFHQKTVLKKTREESVKLTIKKCEDIWPAGISKTCNANSLKKLKRLLMEWDAAKRGEKCTSDSQVLRETKFKSKFEIEFSLADTDGFCMLHKLADKIKNGSITSITREASSHASIVKEVTPNNVEGGEKNDELSEEFFYLISEEEISSCQTNDEESEEEYKPEPKKRKIKNLKFLTPAMCSALDLTNTSNRKGMTIIATTVDALGHNLKDYVFSHSTIRRERLKSRKRIADMIKTLVKPGSKIIVQWDGKLLSDYSDPARPKVDRLPVLVVGLNIDFLLGVPKLKDGTAIKQLEAIIKLLEEYSLCGYVAGMCFDTTATNTGVQGGTCVLLEKKLNKKLLHLACRHHVAELVLRAAFESVMGVSSGPDVTIFKNFESTWDDIDKNDYKSGISESGIKKKLQNIDDLIDFPMKILEKEHQPRGDYKELLELIIIFLGGTPPGKFSFKRPGAVHHARWLAKALYSLKIFLFRDQVNLPSDQKQSLKEICIFIVVAYQNYWFTATKPHLAASNDLKLVQTLSTSTVISSKICKSALDKMQGHLTYLSEVLIALAFFDNTLSSAIKKNLVNAVKTKKSPLIPSRDNLAVLDLSDLKKLKTITLDHFASMNSLNFFRILNISSDFLDSDPDTWETNLEYLKALEIVKKLPVVNDNAERAVALATTFNESLVKDEDQRQYLLQTVHYNRKKLRNCNRESLYQFMNT